MRVNYYFWHKTSTDYIISIIGMVVMSLLAGVSLIWPFHRMFWGIPISTNEGWNAFYADAAMGRAPLYPSLEQLITNNYPPLSFYVVGFFGKIIGDNVLAGRFISFGAVLIIALLIGRMIKNLSSKSPSAAKGFVAPVLEQIVPSQSTATCKELMNAALDLNFDPSHKVIHCLQPPHQNPSSVLPHQVFTASRNDGDEICAPEASSSSCHSNFSAPSTPCPSSASATLKTGSKLYLPSPTAAVVSPTSHLSPPTTISAVSQIVTISSAVIGASYFAATMSCFFNTYVGMNDPQLLAEVIMLIGFCIFLHAYSLTVQSSPPAEASSELNERPVHWWYRLIAPFVKKGSEQLPSYLDHSYALAILIMVIAGFFKHNIITFPLVALFLLIRQGRWKELVSSCYLAFTLILLGFILCYWCYGMDFFHNFLTPRTLQYSNLKMPSSWNVFYVFRAMYVGLLLWVFIRWKYYYAFLTRCLDYFTYSFCKHSINPSVECEGELMRHQSDPSNFNQYSDLPTAYSLQSIASIRPVGRIVTMQLIDSIIVIGLLVHVLQRFGDGVWSNSGFDLLIGVSLAVGFSWDCLLTSYKTSSISHSIFKINLKKLVGALIPIVVLVLLCNCLLRAPRFHSPSYLVSSEFQQEIEKSKKYIAQKIDQVRVIPGNVFYEPSVLWRAGKPFVVDAFNVEERIKAGKLPHDIIEQKVKNHTLITIPWDSSKLFLE